MVGGKIYQIKDHGDFVRFTVRGTGCEKNDLLDIDGAIPDKVKPLLEKGKCIWFQGKKLFITIFETEMEFQKVGYSGNHRHIPKGSKEYIPYET